MSVYPAVCSSCLRETRAGGEDRDAVVEVGSNQTSLANHGQHSQAYLGNFGATRFLSWYRSAYLGQRYVWLVSGIL